MRHLKFLLVTLTVLFAVSLIFMAPFCNKKQHSGLSLLLVDDPIDSVTGVYVKISEIEVHGDGKPIPLELAVNDYVNLLDLQNGAFAMLVDGSENANALPPGQYSNMKVYIEDAYVIEKDGTQSPAEVPPDKFNVSGTFTIYEDAITEVYFVFHASNSIKEEKDGWKLHPSIKLVEKVVSGSVSGTVSPIPYQTKDENGNIVEEMIVKVYADQGTEDEAWTMAELSDDGLTAYFKLIPLREGTHPITVTWTVMKDINGDGVMETNICNKAYGDVTVVAEQDTAIGLIDLGAPCPLPQ